MSKQEYNPPTGQPPSWSQSQGGGNQGYVPQSQPAYQGQGHDRGYHQQQGYPPQQGYYHQQQQGYPPPQQGYYQQQQPMYVQQQQPSGGGNSGCLMGCLAAMCMCCALDAIF